jgi:hypothetical protein
MTGGLVVLVTWWLLLMAVPTSPDPTRTVDLTMD